MVKSSYEIAEDIKSLINQGKKNPEILNIVGIKKSQLTNYKLIIKNGKIEALKAETPLRKIISDIRGAKGECSTKSDVVEKEDKRDLEMIKSIEQEDSEDELRYEDFKTPEVQFERPYNAPKAEEDGIEYFVRGKRKFAIV